jgi:hypothetical protein
VLTSDHAPAPPSHNTAPLSHPQLLEKEKELGEEATKIKEEQLAFSDKVKALYSVYKSVTPISAAPVTVPVDEDMGVSDMPVATVIGASSIVDGKRNDTPMPLRQPQKSSQTPQGYAGVL